MSKTITQCIISASAGRLQSLPPAGCHSSRPEAKEAERGAPHPTTTQREGHPRQAALAPGGRGFSEGGKWHAGSLSTR